MSKCGSCGNLLVYYIGYIGTVCNLCGKMCHATCLIYPPNINSSLPGVNEDIKNLRGWICLSCISKIEIQIINTIPLQNLPKFINCNFYKNESKARLLERMSNNE